MNAEDRAAIERLFARLADFEDRAPRRDPQAEAFIARCVARQPAAVYYLAQTVVAQEQALREAEARLGDGPRAPRGRSAFAEPERDGPWGRASGGGGFLAGAAQTAMGVAGGVMLGSLLGGMFAGDPAEAEETQFDDPADDMGGDDFGGDFDL